MKRFCQLLAILYGLGLLAPFVQTAIGQIFEHTREGVANVQLRTGDTNEHISWHTSVEYAWIAGQKWSQQNGWRPFKTDPVAISWTLSSSAEAALAIRCSINPDGTCDTKWRNGNKPIDPGATCSTWTCTSKGDATLGEINEITSTSLQVVASGNTDGANNAQQNINYGYQTRTSGDARIKCQIPNPGEWIGHQESFTGFTCGFTEGGSATDWAAWAIQYANGTRSARHGVPGTSVTSSSATSTVPWLAVQFKDATNTVEIYDSPDNVDYSLITSTTRDLANFRAFCGGTSHDNTKTTTATIGCHYSTTADISDAGAPAAPSGGDDFPIGSASTFNCQTANNGSKTGVEPGDTITLAGGVNTTLRKITNCFGSVDTTVTTNGSFGSDTGWTKGTGWTIGSGRANKAAGTASTLSQSVSLNNGAYYLVKFDVVNTTAGWFVPSLGGTASERLIHNNVTGGELQMRAGSGGTIAFAASADFNGSIDNVSVRRIRPITIRNDTTASQPSTIKNTASFLFALENYDYVTIDGTGGYVGATSNPCGSSTSAWPSVFTTGRCGLKFVSGGANNTINVSLRGRRGHVQIRGVEIDGTLDTVSPAIGLSNNHHNYSQTDHPGEWVEATLLENFYIHDMFTECLYWGPNTNAGTPQGNVLRLRNQEARYGYVHDCGNEAVNTKSWYTGINSVHHILAHDSGLSPGTSGANGFDVFNTNTGVLDVFNAIGYDAIQTDNRNTPTACFSMGTFARPAEFGPANNWIYNVVGANCERGIRLEGGDAETNYLVEHSTMVDMWGLDIGVDVGGGITSTTVRNSILVGVAKAIDGSATTINNRTGSVAAQNFLNTATRNYRLTAPVGGVGGSPARNAATGPCPAKDLANVTRPQEGTCDQGAFEYVPP